MGQEKDIAALDILEAFEEYFLETLLAWLKPPSLDVTKTRNGERGAGSGEGGTGNGSLGTSCQRKPP